MKRLYGRKKPQPHLLHRRYFIGTAVAGAQQRTLTADPATLSLTGIAATLKRSYKVTGSVASLTLTGISSNTKVRKLGSPQTLTLAGISATLKRGLKLSGQENTLTLTGTSAGLFRSKVLIGTEQTLTLQGIAGNLKVSRVLSGQQGNLSLTGIASGLTRDLYVTAAGATLTLTGTSAILIRSKLLAGDEGTLTLTASSATLKKAVKVTALPQQLTFTGSDATLTFTEGRVPVAYSLTGTLTALSLQGTAAAAVYSIADQVRVFDSRFMGSSWIWDYGTYPPGFNYFILAINCGVSEIPFSGSSVSDIGHKIIDNGDGTVTYEEQVSVSTDKTDEVSKVNFEVVS